MNFAAIISFLLLYQVTSESASLTTADEAILSRHHAMAIEKWGKEISLLENKDSQEPDPQDAILFVGSSSIRRWESMAEDMAPWPTVRRGYGGAKLSDLVIFIQRIIAKHDYRALVIFVGNDITGGEDDRTPDEVLELYQLLIKLVRKTHPQKPIFFIAITPNSKRFDVWPAVNAANRLIQRYSATDPLLHYIDTVDQYLDRHGKPRDELFTQDKLHQNEAGYRIWASIIKSQLEAKLAEKR